jgi:hypothetical protein
MWSFAVPSAVLLAATAPVPPVQVAAPVTRSASTLLPGFHRSQWFGEQVHEAWIEPGVRVVINAPRSFDPARPTRLIIYATPNGNSIEQTLGSALTATGIDGGKTDWHFDVQHIAAQVRRLREVSLPGENIVLAVIEAEGLSWPAWRRTHPDSSAIIRCVVDTLREQIPGPAPARVLLTGHSGGGSFLFGFLNADKNIPDWVERIAFLDANYSYSDAEGHGDKLLAWLKQDASHRLTVIAYDDRQITLDGKKVVGPDGGTFRATQRMVARFAIDTPLTESRMGTEAFVTRTGLDGRLRLYVHPNPANKILHTVLVGEMNGLLEAVASANSPSTSSWGTFGGPRAYAKWVQPAAGIPPRQPNAPGGTEFLRRIADLPPAEREDAIADEICRGNLPDFLRRFVTVTAHHGGHTATYQVMPDYLAIGSDADFIRIPMTPQTAQRIADAFGCALPTRKVVNDVYRQAAVKLEPRPLTEAREAVTTFAQHNALVEEQRNGKPLGSLVAGIKKDVVITNRLAEKPNRVAIYGWHKPDGSPIQPLTIVHRETYVDYSHGVRLTKRTVTVDGRPCDIRHALHASALSPLLSDEGPIARPAY